MNLSRNFFFIFISATLWTKQTQWKLTFPISTRFVSITIVQQFSCQIIRQKSFIVSWVGPFKHNINNTLQKATEINSTLQSSWSNCLQGKSMETLLLTHWMSSFGEPRLQQYFTKWHQKYKTLYKYSISYQKANLDRTFYKFYKEFVCVL